MWLIGLLCIALAGAGLWLMRLPAGYRVERVQRFARTADFMQAYLLDYPRWQDWSPWLLHDPQTELHFFGQAGQVGSGYGWQSQSIGQGEISTDAIKPGQSTALTLKFMKPFKSQAQVFFEFHEVAKDPTACELRWVMDAKVPLPMRPFVPMFEHMIGMDFDLGLARMVGALDSSAPTRASAFWAFAHAPRNRSSHAASAVPWQACLDFLPKRSPSLLYRPGTRLAASQRVSTTRSPSKTVAPVAKPPCP
jgi:hypothetical protein